MFIRGITQLIRTMRKMLAFGNPLLDTIIYLNDDALLRKYNLKNDGHQEISENEMKNLSKDVSSYEQCITAGGCAQNSLRVLQWLLKKQCDATIFGSVGKDKEAELLKNLLQKDGVQTRYIQQAIPTGRTFALVLGANSSRIAHVGAAEHLSLNDLMSHPEVNSKIQEADFIYIEGYFLTKRQKTAKFILDLCQKCNKIVIFNICGEYILDIDPDTVRHFAENSNIIFGTKGEFEALRQKTEFGSMQEFTKHLNNAINRKEMVENIIVMTDGSNIGHYICGNQEIQHFQVPQLNESDIKDTTGAGDAFVGGFIAGLCKNKPIEICIKIACYAAYHIIQEKGCTLPDFVPNILD